LRSMKIRFAPLILVCLNVLVVYSQPSGRRPAPRHLYQVSIRDERSGEKRFGFIDKTGKLAIGFDRLSRKAEAVGDFHDGRAVIYFKKEDGNPDVNAFSVGYIDETGRMVIPARFDAAFDFSEGLAYVESKGTGAFINRQGQTVITLPKKMSAALDSFAYGFHEGRAAVRIDGDYGFVDRTGRLLCKGYTRVASFSEGLAAVAVDWGIPAKYGFINTKGELVIPARFAAVLAGHNIGALSHFSEGLASVRVGEEYGFIDKSGQFVIPLKFSFAGDFSEGLAFVRVGEQAGYINKSGEWAITSEEKILKGEKFKEGLAAVGFDRGTGYLNHTGKIIIQPQFLEGGEFVGGVAAIDFRMAPGLYYIDKTGKAIWPPELVPPTPNKGRPSRR
jgi:DNA-binding transcriptional regulator/RsmH inhibitor MraZ